MPVDRRTIRHRRNLLLLLVAIALAVSALIYGIHWWTVGRFWVVTDNAFTNANLIPVYSDATGFVTQVYYEETEHVEKGKPVISLDAQRAIAGLGQAEGELGRAVRSVSAQFEARRRACQQILSRTHLLDKVLHDIIRYQQAVPSGSVSKQTLQNAEDQAASLEADLKAARADFLQTQAQVGRTTPTNHPDIQIAKNRYVDAYIEYARQQLLAPATGYVAKRKAQVGDRVRPGDQVMTIVPLDHVWVEANLWETSLRYVRPGQPALITVDLYGESHTYHGTVEGLVPGTGSVFALLPPDNATGNFIHIVQRVPVRIALREDEVLEHPLRPGLSTVTAIDVSNYEKSPNAALTTVSMPEYRTNVYSQDVANANAKAEEIINANLTLKNTEIDKECTTIVPQHPSP